MIKGLLHFSERDLTPKHMKVMMAVQLCIKAVKKNPNADQIALFCRLKRETFETELAELVERKYLHEEMPTFGALIMTYKIGPMGGTLLRSMMPKAKKAPKQPKRKSERPPDRERMNFPL